MAKRKTKRTFKIAITSDGEANEYFFHGSEAGAQSKARYLKSRLTNVTSVKLKPYK